MSSNPFTIKDKFLLITGASSGIGRAISIECSKLGAHIYITGRNFSRLEETGHMLYNGNHNSILADLSNKDDLGNLVSHLPNLDGIIHAAGFLKKVPLKFISEKSMLETFQPNFFSPAILTQQLYKKNKINNNASIVFISSIASSIASIGNITYMASKGALNSLVRGMALELAVKNIRVNAVEPALVLTDLVKKSMTNEDLEKYLKSFPLKRFGQPEEIAYATIFLLSNASQWITGTSLRIDGGVTLK